MNTVTLQIASLETVKKRLATALHSEPQGSFLSFASAEIMWKVLTAKRWEILRAMTGQGEMAIRAVARGVNRDVKAVHSDITALLVAGIVERGDHGVVFPYDAIHVDFTLTKAA